MNVERLRELVDLLLDREAEFPVQKTLGQLSGELSQLVNNPQHQPFQVQYAATLIELKTTAKNMAESFTPAQISLMDEIGANEFFTKDVASEVENIARDNPLTPAVTSQRLSEIIQDRKSYLNDMTAIQDTFANLGIDSPEVLPGTTELGVLIPRKLFHNRFDEFIKELNALSHVLRIFSQAANGKVSEIEVRQISTSDPQLFLGIDPQTVGAIGRAVTWALDTIKRIADIKRIRSDAERTGSFSEKEIEQIFDKKAKKTIEDAIDAQVTKTLGKPKDTAGQHHQQRGELAWALDSILSRVERGMTFEIKLLPPPQTGAADSKATKQFDDLEKISQQLSFPAPTPAPILELPPPEPPASKASGK